MGKLKLLYLVPTLNGVGSETDMKLPWLDTTAKNKIQSWYLLMQNEFSVKVQEKKTSTLMKIVAFFLGLIRKVVPNVCSQKEFMDDFTTTLYGTVYVSFDLADLKDEDYVNEIGHMVHEFTHVEQFRRELLMPLKYVFSQYWRMRYEVEACCRTLEYLSRAGFEGVDFFAEMNSDLYNIQNSYGINAENMKIAKRLMQAALIQIRNDFSDPSTLVTKAIEFWNCVDRK